MFFKLKFDKTMEEVKHDLENEKDIILLDVRTKEEFEEGYIDGAINLPFAMIEHITYDKDKEIYVMCRSGQRSAAACKRLKEMGYRSVYNVGGIIHWKYPVVH